MGLVYKNEKKLFKIILIFSVIFWLLLVVGTAGMILIWLLVGFLLYLFTQSALISHLKGNGVRVTEQQMPSLYKQFNECCDTLAIEKKPELFILNSDGFLNALATRFLKKHYVVLYSGVVDALQKYPDGLNFYIGHELGHIKRGHLNLSTLLFPGSILPIIGSAYSRACEYSSDLHGLKCCKKPKDAVFAMAVLAMGADQWNKLNIRAYAGQSQETGGFWMSFHELTADYPWLSKRMQQLLSKAQDQETDFPRRNPFAWFLALFVPRLRIGSSAGGLVSVMIIIAIIGILASIALPAYQDYMKKATLAKISLEAPSQMSAKKGLQELSADDQRVKIKAQKALRMASELKMMISQYVIEKREYPAGLHSIGVPEKTSTEEIKKIEMTEEGFILHLRGDQKIEGKTLVFNIDVDEAGKLSWDCKSGSLQAEYRVGNCV